MTDQSLFSNVQSQETPASPSSQANPLADLLSQIKNEKGEAKYKSIEDALIALKHSQEFIPQLQGQLSQKDQELEAARKIAERVAEAERTLEQLMKPSTPAAATTEPVLSADTISNIVTQKLNEIETSKSQKENLTQVISAMTNKFGADSEKIFYGKGAELGLSAQELNALAAKTPKAVLSLFGLTETPTQPRAAGTPQGINTDGFQPQATTFVGKNPKGILVGATTQDVRAESTAARKMVDELHAQGKTVHDLTDPKVFFKMF